MSKSLRAYYREKLLSAILTQDKDSETKWNNMLRTLTKVEKEIKIKT